MKKTKYWQIPEVHFNTLQEKHRTSPTTKRRRLVRYSELRPAVPYLLHRNS